MKNYELIYLLSKYPAGATVAFNAIVDKNKIIAIDEEGSQVEKEIEEVDIQETTIFLSKKRPDFCKNYFGDKNANKRSKYKG